MLEQKLVSLLEGVEGWCTVHKALKLYEIACDPSVRLAAEIGIYGGRSIFPVGLAFKDKGYGVVYGIEAWSNKVATATLTSEVNDDWWGQLDLVRIKRHFFSNLARNALEAHIRIIELPSDAAFSALQAPQFYGQFDLVHIDGSHSIVQSVADCSYWLANLRLGGHIVLDDINWPSIHLAREYLRATMTEIYTVENDLDQFTIFQKVLG